MEKKNKHLFSLCVRLDPLQIRYPGFSFVASSPQRILPCQMLLELWLVLELPAGTTMMGNRRVSFHFFWGG